MDTDHSKRKPVEQPLAPPRTTPLGFRSLGENQPSPQLQDLLDRTAAISFDKAASVEQFIRATLGETYQLALNAQEQKVRFIKRPGDSSKSVEVGCHLVGTFVEDTFIWAWAHESLGLPPFPVWPEHAYELQTIGGGLQGIVEFYTDVLSFESKEDLNIFFTAIQGWAKLDAVYGTTMGKASLPVFLVNGSIKREAKDPIARVSKIFPVAMDNFPVKSHKLAFASYLEFYGFEVSQADQTVSGMLNKRAIEAEFDPADKLIKLSAPPATKPKKWFF